MIVCKLQALGVIIELSDLRKVKNLSTLKQSCVYITFMGSKYGEKAETKSDDT